MTRPAFRVFATTHHGGLVSVIMLRRFRTTFDSPPPAAIASASTVRIVSTKRASLRGFSSPAGVSGSIPALCSASQT